MSFLNARNVSIESPMLEKQPFPNTILLLSMLRASERGPLSHPSPPPSPKTSTQSTTQFFPQTTLCCRNRTLSLWSRVDIPLQFPKPYTHTLGVHLPLLLLTCSCSLRFSLLALFLYRSDKGRSHTDLITIFIEQDRDRNASDLN